MNKEIFGTFIKEIRKEKGLTQQGLADKLHVTDKAVSKWERGLCYPDLTLMETLAEALDISVTELMTCKRNNEQTENEAVCSLLDISGNVLETQRKTIWVKACVLFAVALLLLVSILYFATNVSEIRIDTVAMKQEIDSEYYIYVENGSHLIRLQCPDKATYDLVAADTLSEYSIKCKWNRITYQGELESCELTEKQLNIGGMMDQIGSSMDLGKLFGIECVWQEYHNIYPDPERTGSWLYSYRLWYSGDGSDFFAEGDETTLLTVKDCRSICAYDFDDDGIVELFVLTKYDEEPYMLYDVSNGEIVQEFLSELPEYVAEIFNNKI